MWDRSIDVQICGSDASSRTIRAHRASFKPSVVSVMYSHYLSSHSDKRPYKHATHDSDPSHYKCNPMYPFSNALASCEKPDRPLATSLGRHRCELWIGCTATRRHWCPILTRNIPVDLPAQTWLAKAPKAGTNGRNCSLPPMHHATRLSQRCPGWWLTSSKALLPVAKPFEAWRSLRMVSSWPPMLVY